MDRKQRERTTPEVIRDPFAHEYFEGPLASRLWKYLHLGVHIERDWRVWTEFHRGGAAFVIDLTVHSERGVLAYEDDENATDELQGDARDAILLESGKLMEVCRVLRGVTHRPDDVLYLLSLMQPSLYKETARDDLRHLSSRYARNVTCGPKTDEVKIFYPDPDADPDQAEAYDFTQWDDVEPLFEEECDPFRHYRGKRHLGVHILRRCHGYNVFSDRKRRARHRTI